MVGGGEDDAAICPGGEDDAITVTGVPERGVDIRRICPHYCRTRRGGGASGEKCSGEDQTGPHGEIILVHRACVALAAPLA